MILEFDHSIEIAFEIERLIRKNKSFKSESISSDNYTVTSFKMWFDAVNVKLINNNKYAYPLKIEFNSSDKNKHLLTIEELEDLFDFIPIYKIPNKNISFNSFNVVNINDEFDTINTSSKLYEELYNLRMDNYNILTGNRIRSINVDEIKTILKEHKIPYRFDNGNIQIYDETEKYTISIIISKYKNDKYIISPDIKSFRQSSPINEGNGKKYISLGTFMKHKNSFIENVNESHLAIIVKCGKCNKNIIIDWFSITRNICPYCGNTRFGL